MRICIAICLLTAVHAFGQVSVSTGRNGLKISGFPKPDIQKTLDRWEEQERLRSLRPLLLQAQAIGVECELDEKAKRKLQLIAKRIFNQRTQQAKTQLRSFMQRTGLSQGDEGQASPDLEKKHDPNDPNTVLISGCGIEGKDVITFETKYRIPVMWHPLWQKQLQAELSDKQKEKYEKWHADAYAEQCHAAATRFALAMNEQISLTTSQRRKVVERLIEACPERKPLTGPMPASGLDWHFALKFRDLKSMDDVLTEEQIKLWSDIHNVVTRNRASFTPQP